MLPGASQEFPHDIIGAAVGARGLGDGLAALGAQLVVEEAEKQPQN